MIYVDLPAGGRHGWGVVGDNLASALANLATIERLNDGVELLPLAPAPLLQAVTRSHLRPRRSRVGYTRHVGYTVFELDLEARRAAGAARDVFDVLVAASSWGEQALREGGLTTVTTIHHGVDGARFNPQRASRQRSRDEFVVFSGGKFELRKGQDIAICAFRAFAARHADVVLVAAWHNPWPHLAASMMASPHQPFATAEGESFTDALRRWVADAKLDLRRVELVPPLPNTELAQIYADSDIGLFPNRCEGSTNLVMMEYMACGRTVIATDFSGHRDVLTDANSMRLRGWRPQPISRDGSLIACWCEPDVDEVVDRLEYAYQHRDMLEARGSQAAADLAQWTWDSSARQFLSLLVPSME
jgi:glycosyltransferase involved in cell wall biosynthesis